MILGHCDELLSLMNPRFIVVTLVYFFLFSLKTGMRPPMRDLALKVEFQTEIHANSKGKTSIIRLCLIGILTLPQIIKRRAGFIH